MRLWTAQNTAAFVVALLGAVAAVCAHQPGDDRAGPGARRPGGLTLNQRAVLGDRSGMRARIPTSTEAMIGLIGWAPGRSTTGYRRASSSAAPNPSSANAINPPAVSSVVPVPLAQHGDPEPDRHERVDHGQAAHHHGLWGARSRAWVADQR